jgi:hypothetical protein
MNLEINNIFTCSKVFDASKDAKYQVYSESKFCKDPWTFFIEQDNFKMLLLDEFGRCGFETRHMAEQQRDNFLIQQPFKKCVAVVLKNSDFTEGRGPTLFHKIFLSPSSAHEYIIRQVGIYSSVPQGSPSYYFGRNIHDNLYGDIRYDGYEIKLTNIEVDVL